MVVCCVLCVVCVWCVCCVAWVLVSRFHGVGFHMWVLDWTALPGALPGTTLPGTALPGTAQNFAFFFFLLPSEIALFLLSRGVLSWNFGGVLKAGTLKCARLGSGPPGLAHDSPRTPNVHISGFLTKIPREDPQRDTERAKRWREREEKARNFGAVQRRAVRRRAVQWRAVHQRRVVRRRAVRRRGLQRGGVTVVLKGEGGFEGGASKGVGMKGRRVEGS